MTGLRLRMLGTTALLLALAGCGGSGGVSTGSGWTTTDACATLPKEKVAAAAGAAVTAVELAGSSPAGGGRAAVSTCTYMLANGEYVGVLLREAEEDDPSDAAIAEARSGGGIMPPSADVPGPGKAALWSKDLKSLQVFYDGRRYAAINVTKPAPGRNPLKLAQALAELLK